MQKQQKKIRHIKDYIDVSKILTSEDALRKVNKEVDKDLKHRRNFLCYNHIRKILGNCRKTRKGCLFGLKLNLKRIYLKETSDYKVLVEPLMNKWRAIDIKKHKEIISLGENRCH
jgi:hypothetical protein